jgi:phosphatidate phosphatase APP1
MTLEDGLFDNLWRNLGLLSNNEKAGVKVTLVIADQYQQVVTDEEGYFRFEAALPETVSPGWTPLSLTAFGIQPTTTEVLLLAPVNTLSIITDIDDTNMVSTVTDTAELLHNTFLKNPLQRLPVSGVTLFLAALDTGGGAAAFMNIMLSRDPRRMIFMDETCSKVGR